MGRGEGEHETLALFFGNSVFHYKKKPTTRIVYLLLLSLLSCTFIVASHFFFSFSSSRSILYSLGRSVRAFVSEIELNDSSCSSSLSNGTICCDRSSIRTDVCTMKGDIRTRGASSSILLYLVRNTNVSGHSSASDFKELRNEKIKPYTRKWEASVMETIDELSLVVKEKSTSSNDQHHCDVKHDVPGVFFSTGGYTGNVYHDFNDGLLPLYVTVQHLKKNVVFMILDYHNWWMMKYGDILVHLTDYPAIDFRKDDRNHCFPEAIIGLRIHDELTIEPSLMLDHKSILDFRNLLDRAYKPRIKSLIKEQEGQDQTDQNMQPSSQFFNIQEDDSKPMRPKLVILSRIGSRAITNEDLLVNMAKDMGFRVELLRPDKTTELARIYHSFNSSDVMIGVHGAAMTHFLFMRLSSVFIQVIPLGTVWPAETYYGQPSKKLGLRYIGYQILPSESSLYKKYDKNDPVLRDPKSIVKKGWQYTKTIYLDNQNVTLNLRRFRKRLVYAHYYSVKKTKPGFIFS